MQTKSTRAFRTISEAGDELDLQPHVLRFWESKFPQIQPMKRSGGRRFYRPEDIEFIRGIKILLHREKHPIKDVQKLIRIKGHKSVSELGRSVEKAANPKKVKETNLMPHIKPAAVKEAVEKAPRRKPVIVAPPEPAPVPQPQVAAAPALAPVEVPAPTPESKVVPFEPAKPAAPVPVPAHQPAPAVAEAAPASTGIGDKDRADLETALSKLKSLKSRWDAYK